MPTYEVDIPGKGTFEVTSKDELTDEQAYQYAVMQSDQEKPTVGQQAQRQLGLTARYGIEGGLGLADVLASPIRSALNLVLPESMKASPIAPQIANILGLPSPETALERTIGEASKGMAGAGGGQAIAQLTRPVSQLGQTIRQAFTQVPGTQITGAGTAGGAVEIAREAGAGPIGQTVTGLVAGLTPAVPSIMASRTAGQVPAQTQQIIEQARRAGYTIPPSQTNPSITNKVLESFSGKIKTNQAAAAKNQERTNETAKKALGLPKDATLDATTLNRIRSEAGQAYAQIANTGLVKPSKSYFDKLDDIVSPYVKAQEGFPDAPPSPVIQEISSLKSTSFDASSGVAKIAELRENASKAYASGDSGLGKAYKSAAGAIEDVLDRHLALLSKSPEGTGVTQQMLSNFRNARQLIAKTYTIEKALNTSTGNVVASNLAAQLKRGKPLSGEIKTIAEVAQAFPKAVQPSEQIGSQLPLSPLDFAAALLGYGVTANPFAAAGLVARPATRSVILSQPYQTEFGRPGGMLGRAQPSAEAVGGLLGTQYGMEQ